MTRTTLPERPERDLHKHTSACRCIFLSNQATDRLVWGQCICCTPYCLHKNSPEWVQCSGCGEGVWLGFSLSNYGKQIFSFFNHIVHKIIVLFRIGVLNGNMESIGTIYPPYPPQFMHLSQLQVQDCWAVNTKLQVFKGMFTTFGWFLLLEDFMNTIKPFL